MNSTDLTVKRLGILGGTFDPIHYGHLLMAETCRQELGLSEVKFLPAGQPPHKEGRAITDGHARADMIQLAVSGYSEFSVDRRELRRQGPSYTVDTLTEFRELLPDAKLHLIIGADSLKDLLTWKSPDLICELATVVAVNRPGLPELTKERAIEWVGAGIAGSMKLLSMPGTDLSASHLRERVRSGLGLRFMTPRAVESFIDQHQIYG